MTLYPGNMINPLYGYIHQGVEVYPKVIAHRIAAYAKIDHTQVDWTLWVPSQMPETCDIPLVIPGSSKSTVYIYSIGMRVSKADLLGTNGEKLKIAETPNGAGFSGFNGVLDVTNGKIPISPERPYASDGYGIIQMPGADASLEAPLGEMPGWKPRLFNVTAGGTAFGSGIRSADPKKCGIVIVEICYLSVDQLVVSEEALFKSSWSA